MISKIKVTETIIDQLLALTLMPQNIVLSSLCSDSYSMATQKCLTSNHIKDFCEKIMSKTIL